ncbi:hypothetical protein HBH70_067730 [Parastagonospora nodorum]|nr:hypothetical protein HBH70_067730 [Parastagonospora nodorum]
MFRRTRLCTRGVVWISKQDGMHGRGELAEHRRGVWLVGWDGMGWDGMGWDGMGWDGMGWDGMGWDGMDGV